MSDIKKPPTGDTFTANGHVRCVANTKHGRACPWIALAGSKYCLNHDPAKAVERAARAQQLGQKSGQARRARPQGALPFVDLASTETIREFLEQGAAELAASKESATSKAHARARLASCAMELLRVGDLAERIAELERKLCQ